MTLAAVSRDDKARVALLQTTRLLDAVTAPPAFDALVRQLGTLTQCPLVALNLVDAHRAWSLSSVGTESRQASRADSLCGLALRHGTLLTIGDTTQDERSRHLAPCQGPDAVRAYAGQPLVVEGQTLGVLCIMDRRPRTWRTEDLNTLRDLGMIAAAMLESAVQAERAKLLEERMRTASLAGNDWLWETDRDGVLTWVSASLMPHTGIDPASEIGLQGVMLYIPREDDTRDSWERLQRARARREPFTEAIADRVTPRGRITVSISGTPTFNRHGEFMGYRGASRIVTRQIEAEEGARRSDQLLRQAIESFQISVMITDPEGRVVLANRNWKDLNRHAHDDGTGFWRDTLLRLIRQGAYPDALGQEDRFLSWRMNLHQQVEPAEIRFLDRWLLLKDHQLPDRSVVHFAMDITQSKRDEAHRQLAAEKLRVSEELYRSVAATISDGLVIVELGGRVVAMNPAASRILGVARDELLDLGSPGRLGLTLLEDDLVTPLPLAQWPIAETLSHGGRVADRIHPLRRPDGSIAWVETTCHLLRVDGDAPPFAAMATLRDVTRERLAQQAEKVMREKQAAEAASKAKTQFLSRMSHEIRTPLNAIHGFAQLLQLQLAQQPDKPGGMLNYVEQILHAGRHLMGLVNDVLDLQQVEAGVLGFQPETLRITEEVGQCFAMLSPLASERGITLVNTVDGDACVVADRRRLRQVIMNVGANAIKYNEPGGHVRIGVQNLPEGRLTLTIEDTGPGMSDAQLARLFQPFERLGRETSNIEGTGLGLIITRSLLEAMGGRMDIHSRPGAGTRIGIVLPVGPSGSGVPLAHSHEAALPTLADLSLAATASSLPPSSHITTAEKATEMSPQIRPDATEAPSPLRVLYVEDNRINALLFEEALRPFPQIDLEIAEDGQTAVSLAREKKPDVLVLDAHLPGMSGFEVLKALRQLPHVGDVPAFMCSADAMPEDLARAKAAGFTGYWTKPIDIVAVTEELCRLAAESDKSGDNPAP